MPRAGREPSDHQSVSLSPYTLAGPDNCQIEPCSTASEIAFSGAETPVEPTRTEVAHWRARSILCPLFQRLMKSMPKRSVSELAVRKKTASHRHPGGTGELAGHPARAGGSRQPWPAADGIGPRLAEVEVKVVCYAGNAASPLCVNTPNPRVPAEPGSAPRGAAATGAGTGPCRLGNGHCGAAQANGPFHAPGCTPDRLAAFWPAPN